MTPQALAKRIHRKAVKEGVARMSARAAKVLYVDSGDVREPLGTVTAALKAGASEGLFARRNGTWVVRRAEEGI